MLRKFLKLRENCCLIILSIHILKLGNFRVWHEPDATKAITVIMNSTKNWRETIDENYKENNTPFISAMWFWTEIILSPAKLLQLLVFICQQCLIRGKRIFSPLRECAAVNCVQPQSITSTVSCPCKFSNLLWCFFSIAGEREINKYCSFALFFHDAFVSNKNKFPPD
jgi:hypothetical protein